MRTKEKTENQQPDFTPSKICVLNMKRETLCLNIYFISFFYPVGL